MHYPGRYRSNRHAEQKLHLFLAMSKKNLRVQGARIPLAAGLVVYGWSVNNYTRLSTTVHPLPVTGVLASSNVGRIMLG
jgi:hypothetical protein